MKEDYERIMPVSVEVEAGKTYQWCACGHTHTPPFKDKFCHNCEPVEFKALNNETRAFCNCKQTKRPPFCDGSHALLLMAMLNKSNR